MTVIDDEIRRVIGEVKKRTGIIYEVFPNDLKEHVEMFGEDVKKICWCNPTLVYLDKQNSNEVWVHNRTQ